MLMTQKQLSGYDSIKDWGSYNGADELIAGMCEWTPGAAGEWSHAHNESETEHREEMVDRRDGGWLLEFMVWHHLFVYKHSRRR